jgi:uncharacterized protein YkwD
MRRALTFRTFMILGIGFSIAGAALHLLESPAQSVALTTVEASAAIPSAGMSKFVKEPVVTGLLPSSTPDASAGASLPANVDDVAPATAEASQPSSGAVLPAPTALPRDTTIPVLSSGSTAPVVGIYSAEKASQLVQYMNEARIEAGLATMATMPTLEEVAGVRAEDLAERQYFDHYAPDGSSAFSELSARGVGYGLAGENLARNNYPDNDSLQVAFDALMNSEGHRANILEPRFTRVGVAALLDGDLWIYVTVFMD